MSSPLLVKGSLGILGFGTVATGTVYFGKDLIIKKDTKNSETKTSIKRLIQQFNPHKRLIVFNKKEDQVGKEAGNRYRNSNKTVNLWEVSGWTAISGDVGVDATVPEDFVSKCSIKSNIEISGVEDPLYGEVLSYCTRDALVSDLIKEKNPSKTLLFEESGNGEKGKTPWAAYKSANTDKAKTKDKGNLSDGDSKHNNDDAPKSFKDECKKKFEIKTAVAKNEDYEDVLSWCTA